MVRVPFKKDFFCGGVKNEMGWNFERAEWKRGGRLERYLGSKLGRTC